ncbi:TauD/TfdA family dioxygenase [Aequoribacter fuscus]|jgi:taurine dioxygenase|nr:TauD/TfdA family dioxygenase [Aequoribacter fuscus]QHJ87226.1 TauD/TfdA family dioxygenase [Aequoribacter fuscus]
MTYSVKPTGGSCGAVVEGVDLSLPLSADWLSELREHWVNNKLLIFPNQNLTPEQLVAFSTQFGAIGEDPFFGHIDEHEQVAAIQRNADETTPIFAEIFHTDWSFLAVPPAGTALYGITIPPHGGNTLFADQVAAYEALPDSLRDRVENLMAIHSAELGYAPDGAYGENDQGSGRSMKIIASERAREKYEHPLVRTHHETGKKALFSSAAYIQGFVGMDKADSDNLLLELYAHQTKEEFVYSHAWEKGMLVMWDNRSLLHAATGGYDGYDRLLYRTTIADTRF